MALDAKMTATIITAGVSLIVAVAGFFFTRKNQKDLEVLKDSLSQKAAVRNAKLEYQFEALKRLYQECGPLLFQLSESAERAIGRISRLASTAAKGNLEPGRSWLDRDYFRQSTYYRMIAPLSLGGLLQKSLTNVDLSLDPAIHWQYTLIKQLCGSFADDFDLAGFSDSAVTIDESNWIDYYPHDDKAQRLRQEDPATFWQQGIPRGILDNARTALMVKDMDGTDRVMDYREFQDAYKDKRDKKGVRAPFERIDYLFEDFHPRTRPILWRVLLAQAHLYQALIASRLAGEPDIEIWQRLWDVDKPANFDWRTEDEKLSVSAEVIATAEKIGADYARETTASVLRLLTAP